MTKYNIALRSLSVLLTWSNYLNLFTMKVKVSFQSEQSCSKVSEAGELQICCEIQSISVKYKKALRGQ